MRIADGIHRLGASSIVNSYLVNDGGEITIIDAGMPGLYRELPGELTRMGRSLGDVRALVLTHGHSDHIGYAEQLRRERRVPVWIDEADAALARGEERGPSRGPGPIRPALLGFLWFGLLRGGLRRPVVAQVSTFGDGATLDIPGAPRVIAVPGHTPGSAALHLGRRGVLFVGDAFATYSVTTGEHGPRVAPFTADPRQAIASLDRLGGLDADLVLPGHGDVWEAGVDEAIRRVRAASVVTAAA
jgi:glyoxylase-like metal-dependent hydrolase (beta-lactamase superfamily II)